MQTPRPTLVRALSVVAVLAAVALTALPAAPSAQAAAPHAAAEQRFLRLINDARRAEGREPLAASPPVATVARTWSRRMAADGRLRHNPDASGQLPVAWTRWGENVGWASNAGRRAASAVIDRLHRGFMESDGHRANILGPFDQVGIGVAVDGRGTMWATMVFVRGAAAAPRRNGGSSGGTTSGLRDIAASPHRAAIARVTRRGLMAPCEPGRFCPQQRVRRAGTAAVVARLLDVPPSAAGAFSDVTGRSVINTLAAQGVVDGCGDGRFCPQRPLTRAQLATMLARALPDLRPVRAAAFSDVPDGYVHAEAIAALAGAGITHGCAADRFCPAARVTRGQLASMVVRALDL